MSKSNLKKQINEVVNHPYVGIRITPMLGDFISQSKITVDHLYMNGIVDRQKYHYLLMELRTIQKTESNQAIHRLVSYLRSI